MEEKEQGKRLSAEGGKGKKAALVAVIAAVCVLLGGYLGLCAYASGDRFLPGTQVAGIDLGGRSYAEAAALLEDQGLQVYADMELPILVGDKTVTLSAKDAGVTLDVEAALEAAKAADQGSFLTAGGRLLGRIFGGKNEAECPVQVGNTDYVDEVLVLVAESVSQPVEESTWAVNEEQNILAMVHGRTGQTVDMEGIYDQVVKALAAGDATPIVAQVVTTAPAELDFEAIAQEVDREPVNATLDVDTDEVVPHQVGLTLDVAAAKAAFAETSEGESCTVSLETTEPEVTTLALRASLFRDVLGEASSNISGDSNRFTNVRLASEACDGTILLPGEQMSYNQTTGQRTRAKGYQVGTGYTAAGLVDMVGGGVCQPSSTLYLACLNADLEIVERKNHMYTVSYMPEGMDATVNWPNLDYVFANNTAYPIKVEMKISGRTLTAKIYGTKTDDHYVKMESVRLSSTPATTVYQEDSSVPQGSTRVVQIAHTGKKVQVYKNIYDGQGNRLSRELISTDVYLKTDQIIAYNPADGAPGIPPKLETDPDTGWSIDPTTGWPVDPSTGLPVDPNASASPSAEPSAGQEPVETTSEPSASQEPASQEPTAFAEPEPSASQEPAGQEPTASVEPEPSASQEPTVTADPGTSTPVSEGGTPQGIPAD